MYITCSSLIKVSTLLFLHQARSYELRRMLKLYANAKRKTHLTRQVWGEFMSEQRDSRLLYYKTTAIAEDNLYYGKGMEPGRKPWLKSLLPKPAFEALKHLLPRGWIQDYAHFLRNAHPVVSVFYSSAFNPFTKVQRVELMVIDLDFCFVLTVMQILFMEIHRKSWRQQHDDIDDNWTDTWSSFFFVTVPQVAIQRLINELSRAWRVEDESEKPRNCLRRRYNFCLSVIGMNAVTSLFFLSAATVVWTIAFMVTSHPELKISNTVGKFVLNSITSYVTMVFLPIVQEFNPSSTLCELALLMQDVRSFLISEAVDLLGTKVVIYNSSHKASTAYLTDAGEGVVLGVDEGTGRCIVKVTTEGTLSTDESSHSRFTSMRAKCSGRSELTEFEEGGDNCYLIDVTNLARTDLIGECVAVEVSRAVASADKQELRARSLQWLSLFDIFSELGEEGDAEEDDDVYTCESFDANAGLYAVSCTKSDELLYFAPNDVRFGVNVSKAEAEVEAAAEAVVMGEEELRDSIATIFPTDEKTVTFCSEVETMRQSLNPLVETAKQEEAQAVLHAADEVEGVELNSVFEARGSISTDQSQTDEEDIVATSSNFNTLLRGVLTKGRSAQQMAIGVRNHASSNWIAVAAMNKALALKNQIPALPDELLKEGAGAMQRAQSTMKSASSKVSSAVADVKEKGVVLSDMYGKAQENMTWATSQARQHTSHMVNLGLKAAELAAARAANADAEAKLRCQRFARHPLGRLIAPLLGWFMLDFNAMCGWRRQQGEVLAVIRDAIANRGAEHMSDPFVELRQVPNRQKAARELEPEQRVLVVGPNRNSISGEVEIDVSRRDLIGQEGVIVEGGSKVYGSRPHLVTKGIHWRHLTSDFKVYVQLAAGLKVVPADWLEGLETAPDYKLRQSSAYNPDSSSCMADVAVDMEVDLPEISSTEVESRYSQAGGDRASLLSKTSNIRL